MENTNKGKKEIKKSPRISVRISEPDMKILKSNAEKVKLTVSEYIRMKAVQETEQVLYDPDVREAVFEVLALLREMGSFVHRFGRGTVQEEYLKELNSRLSAIIDSLYGYLKGGVVAHGGHKTSED